MAAEKSEYGFGIVGCGMVGRTHVEAIEAMEGGRLECVFSRNAERAQELVDEFGCTAYSDYAAFLDHPGLDIVTIATPSGAHLDPALEAARAGKHLIVEKPLEVTLERIDALIEGAAEAGVVMAGIFPRRFNDAVIAAKQAMDAGRLGNLALADACVRWWRDQEYYDSGAWRGTWALDGGGALMNQSIHTVDLLLHLAGDVASVSAFAGRAAHDRIEVEDVVTATVRFRNGAIGTIIGSTACYSPGGHGAEVHLCGRNGSIYLKDDKFTAWEFREETSHDEEIRLTLTHPVGASGIGASDPRTTHTGHQRNFEDVVNALHDGRSPSISGADARRPVELILAIYASAQKGGEPVALPLTTPPEHQTFA